MSRTLLYRQVAGELRDGIRNGVYPIGSMLPPRADIVRRFSVSHVTARTAVNLLEAEGLVKIEPGRGVTVVSDRAAHPDRQAGLDTLWAELHALREEIESLSEWLATFEHLHPNRVADLPQRAIRVLLEAQRLWDTCIRDAPSTSPTMEPHA